MTPSRRRWLAALLWLSAFAWAIGLGAKVFDLAVLGSAWGRLPPASLALLPYGRSYPIDPGDFFQPLSALLLLASVGALVAGWPSRRTRRWLWVPVLALASIWLATPTLFWPMIDELWGAARGRIVHTDAELGELVRRWFVLDGLRIVMIATGFAATVRALGLPIEAGAPRTTA